MNDHQRVLPQLNNTYFALRHGRSEANAKSIIVSDPRIGTTSYGLTDEGIAQVKLQLEKLPEKFDSRLKIFSSDFLRTRETAAIIASGLGVLEPVRYREHLRERNFGALEGKSDSHYQEVWHRDRADARHSEFGVESALSVVARTVGLVCELESLYQNSVVLLVAHGDVLQLLQTAFARIPAALHRQLPALQVAEIRQLIRLSP